MKQELKGNLLSPLPVVLVGAMVNSRPNYLVIGYISPFDFGRYIFFSLYKKRYTRIGIHQNRTFSVNIPSEDLLAGTAVCGSKSGRDFDKGSLFDTFYGELKTAPMIRQCLINMECEMTEILDYDPNEGIIGHLIESYYRATTEDFLLTHGKISSQTFRDRKLAEEQVTTVLNALKRLGFNLEFDEKKISQLIDLRAGLDRSCEVAGKKKFEIEDEIWNLDDLNFLTKMMATDFAGKLLMSDDEFARQQETRKKLRDLLLSLAKK